MRREEQNATQRARWDQSVAYAREHDEDFQEIQQRLYDAAFAYVQFGLSGGLSPAEALGELFRFMVVNFVRGEDDDA